MRVNENTPKTGFPYKIRTPKKVPLILENSVSKLHLKDTSHQPKKARGPPSGGQRGCGLGMKSFEGRGGGGAGFRL